MTVLSHAYDIIVGLDIVLPGNGKYFVDGLNNTAKIICQTLWPYLISWNYKFF